MRSQSVVLLVAFVAMAAGLRPGLLPCAPSRVACGALPHRARVVRAMELLPDDADAPGGKAASTGKGFAKQKKAKTKAKTKTDRFEVQFTCNVCEGCNTHSISRHAYTKGTVIVTCPHCKSAHLIADNLNWIENDFRNLEEFMEKRGTPVSRVVTDGTAVAATAAAASRAAQAPAKSGSRAEGGGEEIDLLDGITEDMALRIRQAVRDRKRRQAEEAAEAEGSD